MSGQGVFPTLPGRSFYIEQHTGLLLRDVLHDQYKLVTMFHFQIFYGIAQSQSPARS